MTRTAKESPPGSGNWTVTGEPHPRHPREAPQFECSFCGKRIAKDKTVYLTPAHQAACLPCVWQHDDPGVIMGTRAYIASVLGIRHAQEDTAARTPAFRVWLRQFRHDENAIGDLARDVLADPDWPRGPGSLARYEEHLKDAGARDSALDTLRTAWARYGQESPR